VEQAFGLERLVMRGDADAALMAAAGIDAPEALVRDLERDLRALLRDAVCGHLPADLRGVADEILDEPTGAAAAAPATAEVEPPGRRPIGYAPRPGRNPAGRATAAGRSGQVVVRPTGRTSVRGRPTSRRRRSIW
jgi:hypothetical protein